MSVNRCQLCLCLNSFAPVSSPSHPGVQRLSWPQAAAARGGWTLSLICVSVPLLSLMTDQGPLRLIQYQNGIRTESRYPPLASLTPYTVHMHTLKNDLTAHFMTNTFKVSTHKPQKPPHLWRERNFPL